MECKWLEDFLSVARTGSFSRSAAERHITQSAFSRRIKSLEQWAGGALIDRSTYPTRLTPAGERFRDVAEQAVSLLQEARLDLRATIDARGSTLRVAAPHALAGDFLTGWLGRVRDRLGDMPVEVRADNLHDCVRDLDEGNVDLLICHVHEALPIGIDAHRFPWTKIADTQLVPVSVPERAGRPRFSLRRNSPRPIPMLRYGPESYLGRVAALIVAQLALERSLRVVYESAHTESLRAAAVAGLGIAWLPRHFVQDDLQQGRLLHAGDARHEVPLDVRLHVNRARLEGGPAAALAHEDIA
jgi:LysR family transcriptional regulator, hypochlorite-specific transcription factor HypT